MLYGVALFAGYGGLELGISLALGDAYRTVVAVEGEAFAASVLVARQQDGSLPPFAIWDDVRTFDGRWFREQLPPGADVLISGGFPCQDISAAGRGAGITAGTRSGLWYEMARVIRDVRPRYVFVENVAALLGRGLDIVLGDLAGARFDAEWLTLSAAEVGASHKRARVFILAESPDYRYERSGETRGRWSGDPDHRGDVAYSNGHGFNRIGSGEVREDRDASHGCDADGRHADVADAGCEHDERRREHGNIRGTAAGEQGEAQEWQRNGNTAGDGSADVADAEHTDRWTATSLNWSRQDSSRSSGLGSSSQITTYSSNTNGCQWIVSTVSRSIVLKVSRSILTQ